MTHKTQIKWIKICFYVVGILLVFATVLSFIAKQYVTAVCDILWLSFIVIELRDLKLQDEIANDNQKFFGFVSCLGKIVNEHGIAYVVPKEDDNDYLVAKEPENINKEEEK